MNLLKSIADIWEDNAALCALIPFERVFTGRVPQTQQYAFPYVSIIAGIGRTTHRTDKTRYSHAPVTFHVWVDDADLSTGLEVAKAITDAYADRCWPLGDNEKVYDVLDEGEPLARQTDMANVKAWEVVKLMTMCTERYRAVNNNQCCQGTEDEETSSTV